MNKFIDISMLITPSMMVYKNKEEKKPMFSVANTLNKNGSYETTLTMNLHTGTHLDFPLHMIEKGSNSTNFNLHLINRQVKVLDLTSVKEVITQQDLVNKNIEQGDFLLLKTTNSQSELFDFNFVYLSESAAAYLVKKGIAGVGIDALGIERLQPDHQTHHLLMHASILIIEGLRLKDTLEKTYTMIALPLSIPGMDALPLRAVLIHE
jgi:arylformamidase